MGKPVRGRIARIWAHLSPPTKLGIAVVAALVLASRLGIVLTAIAIGRAEVERSVLYGVVASIVLAASRVASSRAKIRVECDLIQRATEALLDGDVFASPVPEPRRAIYEASYHAPSLVAQTIPGLVADAIATAIAVPIVISAVTPRLSVALVVGLVVAIVGVSVLRRLTARLQAEVVTAEQRVFDRSFHAIDGRIELVAQSAERSFNRRLEEDIAVYRSVAQRSAAIGALLGRAPIALGVATIAIAIALDASSRDALTTALLAKSIVLAACIPPILGLVLGLNEVSRSASSIATLDAILAEPKRAELARAGKSPPPLPTDVSAKGIAFAYAAGQKILHDLSFEWDGKRPLVVSGRNGVGKSTLFRAILGLRDSDGSLRLGGAEVSSLAMSDIRQSVAYLPQRPYLGEAHATLRDSFHLVESEVSDDRIRDVLGQVKLRVDLDARIGELSAGQRQRLAIGRVLARRAKFVFLDEPDANLDREGIELVVELVEKLVANGTMVAIAAHSPELLEVAGSRVEL